jgi:hypothetical protein
LGLHKAGRKLAASTSPSDPNTTQSHERLIQSANRNTVENNLRNNQNQQQQRQKDNNAMKKKTKTT